MSSKLCRRLAAALAAALLVGSAALPQAAVSTGVKIPILTYHDLTRDPDDVDDMTVTDERFRLDMEFLKEFGYTPLLSADLVAIHKGAAAMPDKPVMITFDDGYWSNYSIAYPILQQTGMKAVISVIAHNMEGDAPVISDTPGEETAEAETAQETAPAEIPETAAIAAAGLAGAAVSLADAARAGAVRTGTDMAEAMRAKAARAGAAVKGGNKNGKAKEAWEGCS